VSFYRDRRASTFMLIIKQQQIDALVRPGLERFERSLADHLRAAWPRECRLVGDDAALLDAVRRIVGAAHAHGFETERELTLYAMLVISLGFGFATDPQLMWAATSLGDQSIEDPTKRIEALYDEMVEYLGEIGGEDSERAVRALLRVRRYDFLAAPASEGEAQVEDICDVLETFWPEKLEFQETSPTLLMIRRMIDKAARYGIVDPTGRCVFSTIGFFFGHDFDADPLQPWAAAVLNDRTIADGSTRAKALLRVGLERAAQSLARE
jgi:hypothetical protein